MQRRDFLRTLTIAGAAMTAPELFAQGLLRTPEQFTGPFYPDKLPLDTDNDLLIINDRITPAVGAVTWLSGRILGPSGEPIRDALVEIWQVDGNGAYIHTRSSNREKRDANFQGYGRFLTGSTGEYLFRTVKPVPYPGRTAHIHFNVKIRGQETFTTQMYVDGQPENARDPLLRDPKARAALIVPFTPMRGSPIGELSASFNIVLGFTPRQG
jgi:protocatechuate 3,4-dioxygenase beta subunit